MPGKTATISQMRCPRVRGIPYLRVWVFPFINIRKTHTVRRHVAVHWPKTHLDNVRAHTPHTLPTEFVTLSVGNCADSTPSRRLRLIQFLENASGVLNGFPITCDRIGLQGEAHSMCIFLVDCVPFYRWMCQRYYVPFYLCECLLHRIKREQDDEHECVCNAYHRGNSIHVFCAQANPRVSVCNLLVNIHRYWCV